MFFFMIRHLPVYLGFVGIHLPVLKNAILLSVSLGGVTTDEMLLSGSGTNEAAEVSGQRMPRSAAASRFVIRPSF